MFKRLRAKINAHPFSAASVDRYLADGRGTTDIPDRELVSTTPVYDQVLAESQAADGLAAEVEAWLKAGAK